MFARIGETLEPCGVPRRVSRHSPSSMTPAPSHLEISRMTRRSPIRCSTNFISQPRSNWSKKARMSASAILPTLRRSTPYASAPAASCAPRPGRSPWLSPRNSGVNRRRHGLGHRSLDDLVLQCRNAKRPVSPVRFRHSVRRDGIARHAPLSPRSCGPRKRSSNPFPYSFHVTPSTPAAASLFSLRQDASSTSVVTWCRSAVELLLRFPRGCLPYPPGRL